MITCCLCRSETVDHAPTARRCRPCDRAKAKAYYHRNRDAGSALQSRAVLLSSRHAAMRADAVRIYGGACVRCGTTVGLDFDHVNNDGNLHRETETLVPMLRRICETQSRLSDWDLQLLCRRCHVAK